MFGVYDRARPLRASPLTGTSRIVFGPRNDLDTWLLNPISRLNTRPACTPTDASGMTSRSCPHGSGPSWVA